MKQGYKQTEVGVIPEDWEVKLLGSLTSTPPTKGSTPTTYGFKWEESGIPFLRSEAVTDKGIETSGVTFIHPDADRFFKRSQIFRGDILITITGYVGKMALFNTFERANINQHLAFIRLQEPGVIKEYIYHHLSQTSKRKYFESIITGQAYPQISLVQVRDCPVSLPPTLREQEAIAKALSDADALIDALEKLIEKKKQIKQGAMQTLLTGKIRLPGFSGDWVEKRLGEVGRCLRGVSYKPDQDLESIESSDTIFLFRSNNVQESRLQKADIHIVRKDCVKPEQILRPHDVLICMANGSKLLVGKACPIPIELEGTFTFGAFMGTFRPDENSISPSFVSRIFLSNTYKQQIQIVLAGSSINNLTPGFIEDIYFACPNLIQEQEAIAKVLSAMDDEIDQLEARLTKTKSLKQGMMQQLLTGRIRLI